MMAHVKIGVQGLICFALIAMVSTVVMASEPTQWTMASGGNGHYYQAISVTNGITWQEAQDVATAVGGYLATATSSGENDFIYSLVSGDDQFWIFGSAGNGHGPWLGGLQAEGSAEPDSGWGWVTGELFVYTGWGGVEPNNAGGVNEDRIILYGQGQIKDKTWADYPALPPSDPIVSYIIEWDPSAPDISVRVSEVAVCWASYTNYSYRVEYTTNLNESVWSMLLDCVPGSEPETCVYDSVPENQSRKYYRVAVTNCP